MGIPLRCGRYTCKSLGELARVRTCKYSSTRTGSKAKMEERGRSLLMAVLLLVAFVPAHCDDSAKPVSTVLRASWPDTPLLLEARYTSINRQNTHSERFDLAHLDSISPPYSCSEFMAEYKESLFWNFVNRTKSLRPLELTDKGMFFHIIS